MPRRLCGDEPAKSTDTSSPAIVTVAWIVTGSSSAIEHGLRRVEVHVKGPGSGRDTAVRSIQNTGIEVTSIKDVTPVPHNGCTVPKRRRG